MAVSFSQPVVVQPRPPRAVSRTIRKIALCGSHSASLVDCPWGDPSWEFWGHASSRAWYARPMDRYFDLHPRACWERGGKKGSTYTKWLAQNTVDIYMQQKYEDVPASRKYPKGQILLQFGTRYFTNHVAWMIALALTEGITELGLFGVNYSAQSEYMMQRGSAEYWLGRAAERGVRLVLPEQCSLLREPAGLYGYESHDEETGVLKAEYARKVWKPEATISPGNPAQLAKPPAHLAEQIAADESLRPAWAAAIISRTDGEARGA